MSTYLTVQKIIQSHWLTYKYHLYTNIGKIVLGKERDPVQRFLDLHVVTQVSGSDAVMLDEIFGPILPIINAENVEDAIRFINSKEKPLR